jgi:hypothetical protein
MTIQIDDAGYGSLVGPTFIGAYRKETGEFVYGEIGLEFFRGRTFRQGEYVREASRVIRSLLERLESPPTEMLEVCTGNIFDDLETAVAHPIQRVKIEGPLQKAIEGVFTHYLTNLGIPINGIKPSARHFRVCLDWVVEDYPAREKYVKTGWPKWELKWRPIVRSRAGVKRNQNEQKRLPEGEKDAQQPT